MSMYLGALAGWMETQQKIDAGLVVAVDGRYYEWQSWEMSGVGFMVGYVAWDKSDHVYIHAYGCMESEMRDCLAQLEMRQKYSEPLRPFKPDGWFTRNLTMLCFIAAGIFILVTFCLPPQ